MTTTTTTDLGHRMFLGWTPDKTRVYVNVQLSVQNGNFQTTDHQQAETVERLSFTGEVYRGRAGHSDRQMVGAGQITGAARAVLAGRLAPGVSAGDVTTLLKAWKAWHLNDMRAACAHVKPVGDSTDDNLDRTPACPHSGYRYGSAWLVDPLPEGLVESLRAICERMPH